MIEPRLRGAPEPSHPNLRALIAERAAGRADAPFLIRPETGETFSYSEMGRRVGAVARVLAERGVGRGTRVSMLCFNGPDFVWPYLAIWSLGAIACPINTGLKGEEIQYVVDHAEASVLVVDRRLVPELEPIRAALPHLRHVLAIDASAEGAAARGDPAEGLPAWAEALGPLAAEARPALPDPPPGGIGLDDPAQIIYTSGTTGKPKGVVLTQRNFLRDAEYIAGWHGLTAADRAMCILPLFHVNGEVVTTVTPLWTGGSVVMPERFTASRHWEWISANGVTWFSAVPTNLGILVNRPPEESDPGRFPRPGLRFAICGAAPLPVEVQRSFERRFRLLVIEGYGLSETTCYSTFNPHPPAHVRLYGEDDGYRRIGSIGVPVGNELAILDDDDRPVEAGASGEICLRGENVMTGYEKRAAETAAALAHGWFHSGDIGYVDADGYVYITDRKKDIIIRGGENIMPREIDEVLYRHVAVRDAATIGAPDPKYGERVVSFVVLQEGAPPAAQDLIDHCRAHLADFKVPAEIHFLDEIPKGPSGKLLRRELRERYAGLVEGV
jgi:acyl-CoA synthetase (AMP-forming)/AMP-acid ligase II